MGAMMHKTERKLVRNLLRLRDGDLCCWCGKLMLFAKRIAIGVPEPTNWATIEHVKPVSEGGTDDLTNLALACKLCNSSRAAKATLAA